MTAPDGVPGVPELMRRVGEVAAQMTALAARLDADYARKDLVDLQIRSLGRSLDDLRKDADAIASQQAAARRLIVTSFIAPILVAVLVAILLRQPNLEGTGEIPLRRLVKEALRMRPDRIIVGEVRQEEALDLLIALNSGLPDSLGGARRSVGGPTGRATSGPGADSVRPVSDTHEDYRTMPEPSGAAYALGLGLLAILWVAGATSRQRDILIVLSLTAAATCPGRPLLLSTTSPGLSVRL